MAKSKHSFRSPERQGHQLASSMARHGKSKRDPQEPPWAFHAVASERIARTIYVDSARYLNRTRQGDLSQLTPPLALEIIRSRKSEIGQQHLDNYTTFLQKALWKLQALPLDEILERERSDLRQELTSRVYAPAQISLVYQNQSPRNEFSARICNVAGCRSMELGSLSKPEELPVTADRNWRADLHCGLSEFTKYTVKGKGGLVRSIAIPNYMVEDLERRRLPEPVQRRDREIHYLQRYDLGFGQALSQSWSRASNYALGFSNGLHGLRHTFAQERVRTLLAMGFDVDDALLIVSQELGHFRLSITMTYFR
jgi:integrase